MTGAEITPTKLQISFAAEIDDWNSIAFPSELGTSLAHFFTTSDYYK
jgi:hypothetical protein